jgi:hypothetical protein
MAAISDVGVSWMQIVVDVCRERSGAAEPRPLTPARERRGICCLTRTSFAGMEVGIVNAPLFSERDYEAR